MSARLYQFPRSRFSTCRGSSSPTIARVVTDTVEQARRLASLERQSSEARARGIWWPPVVRKLEVVR